MAHDDDDRTALSELTAAENAKVLEVLVVHRRSVGELEELLAHPLQHAACDGNVGLLKKLLNVGASPNTVSSSGNSMLHFAANRGNHRVVRALLGYGAHVHVPGELGLTPLHVAALGNNPRTVASLLAGGAQVNFRASENDLTALDVAAVCGQATVLEILRLNGANVHGGNSGGVSALHRAAIADQADAIEDLVQAGADFDAQEDGSGWTPLHFALKRNSYNSVGVLCARGADKNRLDATGLTPLQVGITTRGSLRAVNALLGAGVDPNFRGHYDPDDHDHGGDDDDDTPIPYNDDDNDGQESPLELAAWMGSVDLVRTLLDHGAVATLADSVGRTALHKAAYRNFASVIHALVGAGAGVNASDSNGRRPLHCAALFRFAEAAQALLSHGADVDALDRWRQSPLHRAAGTSTGTNHSVKTVEFLLRWDADETAVDARGCTPAQVLGVIAWQFLLPDNAPAPNNDFVRGLLARAPADRAWRRRSLVVMCRARLIKEEPRNLNLPEREADASRPSKFARVGGRGGGDVAAGNVDGRRIAHRGAAEGASAGDDDDDDDDDDAECVIRRVVGLQEDGVFRNVMKFL